MLINYVIFLGNISGENQPPVKAMNFNLDHTPLDQDRVTQIEVSIVFTECCFSTYIFPFSLANNPFLVKIEITLYGLSLYTTKIYLYLGRLQNYPVSQTACLPLFFFFYLAIVFSSLYHCPCFFNLNNQVAPSLSSPFHGANSWLKRILYPYVFSR